MENVKISNLDSLKQIEALKKAYNSIFSSEDGQKILKDLKRVCFFKSSTINDNPYVTYFNEGQRAVVLHILTRMNLDNIKVKEGA